MEPEQLGDFHEAEPIHTDTSVPAVERPELIVVFMAIGCSVLLSLTTEIIGWLVVFRHDAYKKSVAEIVELQERVEQMQEKLQYA